MVDLIFFWIFIGIFMISAIVGYIKFTIWEYKMDKEIEKMEEELNRLKNEEDESI